jgi:hypothetical protein
MDVGGKNRNQDNTLLDHPVKSITNEIQNPF